MSYLPKDDLTLAYDEIRKLKKQLRAAEKVVEAANNVTVNTTTDFNIDWANKLFDALEAYDNLMKEREKK